MVKNRTGILSEEMQKNGWVVEFDEDGGGWITYNKRYLNEFFSEDVSDKPKISFEIKMIDFTKKENEKNNP